jgi:choline-sulfatase
MPYTGTIPGWGHALQTAGISVESIGKLHYRDASDPAGFDIEHMPMNVADGVGMVWASIRAEDERVTRDVRMLGDKIGPGESKYTKYDAAVTHHTMVTRQNRKLATLVLVRWFGCASFPAGSPKTIL